MARKTKKSKTAVKASPIKKTKSHPRKKSRGWSVLRKRWAKLFSQFGILTKDTLLFWRSNIDQRVISVLLMIVGLIGVGFWANYWWTKNELAHVNQQAQLASQLRLPIIQQKPTPERIFIRWYVDAPVVTGVVFEGNWTLSEKEAVYIAQSARPGEAGNIVIYGHNTKTLLGNIRALRGSEIITLTMTDGSTRDYRIDKMMEIKPEEVWVVEPTAFEVLTLYTCSGFADLKRFVVRALPID